jgi:YD repeat-containing protein
MNDPDMGTWTYSYNALGKLVSQTDAKGQTSTMAYDKLGRMTNTHCIWIFLSLIY